MATFVRIDKKGNSLRFSSTEAHIVQVTFSSSYTTGGEALTAANTGLSRIDFVAAQPTAGYVFDYDYTNAKLKAYRQKDPAAAGGADIALPEVANGVNLSAVTTRALVIGAY